MPDDDYEKVMIGCDRHTDYEPKIFPMVREEDTVGGERRSKNEIKELLHKVMTSVYTDGEDGTGNQILGLVKVLRIMNGIE